MHHFTTKYCSLNSRTSREPVSKNAITESETSTVYFQLNKTKERK